MHAVATSVGAERFGALWRADDSLPDAYRRVTGVPIDTLAQRVVLDRRGPVLAGATVTPIEVMALLAVAAVLAALATLSHPRRRRS